MNALDLKRAGAAATRRKKEAKRSSRRIRSGIGASLVLAASFADLAAAAGDSNRRPLMRDFVGINSHAHGHGGHRGFDPDLYRPVSRLLREYHRLTRDLGDDPSRPPAYPLSHDGMNWETVYGEWKSKGWDVFTSFEFEAIEREKWTDIETEGRTYGRAFARAFGPSSQHSLVKTISIGNEPTAWTDEDYSRMFRAMAQGAREGDPKIRIGTCNVTVGPSGRWTRNVETVALHREFYDILTLHVYAEIAEDPTWQRSYPEDPRLLHYLDQVEALCRWRDQHAPEKEVWITEFGYDSSTKKADPEGKLPHWIGVTDEQQAQWLVRSILVFASMPVARAYIYFFNDRDNPSLHSSAGLTRHFQPKPSFHALAHLQRRLGDYRFQRVVKDEPGRLRIQEFVRGKNADDLVWVVWSPTGEQRTMPTILSDVPGRLVSAERMPLSAKTDASPVVARQQTDGAIEVEVTESPLYLVLKRK